MTDISKASREAMKKLAVIRDAAVDEGMLTLRMDGWMKVMKGITTLEQVIRETSA